MASSYFILKMIRKRHKKKQLKSIDVYNQTLKKNYINETILKAASSIINQCRVCLKEGNIPIYTSEDSCDISDAVRIFGDIDICKDDAFPKHLCEACYSSLQGAILFRKSAKETDKILHNHFPTNLTPTENESYVDNFESEIKTDIKLYNCKMCKLQFKNWEEYLKHKSSKQHRNVRIQCPICYGLLTAQLYKKHLVRHKSASHLICDVCGKLYRKDNLVRHLQLHKFELPYQCQVCPYRGRFMESLKIHMRTHSGVKPFCCDKCKQCFLTRSNLNRHLLTHKKEKPFKCIECGRGFYTKQDMDVHFKADHAGIKDYVCKMCGNKYGTRKALMRHELRVHKRDKMAKGRMPLYLQEEYRKTDEIL